MQFIKDSFADKVRRGKIASPLKPKFSMEKWESAEKITEFDKQLYLAGMMFHLQFTAMRSHLKELQEMNMPLSNNDFLKIFSGISNRNLKVLNDKVKQLRPNLDDTILDLSFFAKKINNNPLNSDLSIEEVSTISVDGVFYNILSHLTEAEKPENDAYTNEQLFDAIRGENFISQGYYIYESYWNSILYEQIKFSINGADIVLESNPEIMIPYEISNSRKTKNQIQNALILDSIFEKLFKNKDLLEYAKESFSVKKFEKLDPRKKAVIATLWQSFNDKTIKFLPKDLPSKKFDLNDLIDLIIQLGSLGYDLLSLLPVNDEIRKNEFNKFMDFSPTIEIKTLVTALIPILNKPEDIIVEMLDFLTFTGKSIKGAPREDLWRKPLIKISNEEFLFILEAVIHPVGVRCVEGWLSECGVDLQTKGNGYEDYIKETLKSNVEENSLIDNFCIAEKETISINSVKEEIDLLFKIDNLIVLGEAKCVVVSDSATSYWHSLEIIKKASEQAQRKIEFIKNNIEEVCKTLSWEYDKDISYIYQPIVLMSNFIGVGYSFFNVPIIDTTILNSYFFKNTCPLVSLSHDKHPVYLSLYETKEELINNFSTYVNNPPSIESYKLFTQVVDSIPIISPYEHYKTTWKFKRIGIMEPNIDVLLSHDYKFPLVITEEFKKLKIGKLVSQSI